MSQMTPFDLFMRDLCEMDPADPADERTVCVTLEQMRALLENWSLEQMRALLENWSADGRLHTPIRPVVESPGFARVRLRARLMSLALGLRRLTAEEDPHLLVALLGPEPAMNLANVSLQLDAALKG